MSTASVTGGLAIETPRVIGARRAFGLVAGLGIAVHGAFALAGRHPAIVDDWLYCGLYLLACGACAYRAIRGSGNAPWVVAALGVFVWGMAELVFRLQVSDPRSLYPHTSQLLLLIAFTLAYSTLALLARERVLSFDPVLALDGAIAGLTAAALAAVLLFPRLGSARPHQPAALPQTFVLGALAGLIFVIAVLAMTGWRPGPTWALIAPAIAINVLGDGMLVHLANSGSFRRGTVADTLFVTSALMLGLASFYPTMHARAQPNARRLPVPLVCSAAALGVLIIAVAGGTGWPAAGLAGAAILLMSVRMSIALELLERSRSQALADDLTGLGNRRLLVRDLQARIARVNEQEPFTLALFDLDGFKRYNDTFGHPSGDALLIRLAGRLQTAVKPGLAYRMGGDEFCVIVDGTGAAAENALASARRALSEQGDAFIVASSQGSVACPAEAQDATSILKLADARMYVAKTGRGVAQAQTRDTVMRMLHERDPRLHEHMRAVAGLAIRVALRLGLDGATARQVERAAELHDVGKIAVPDAILHKPSELDLSEWQLMRRYPVIGERILRSAPALAPVAPLVRSAHERWDGKGYPDGLTGTQAPLGARIIAACDAYHAMRSPHPYRPRTRTAPEALAEIRRCSGTQFDPEVVHALCDEIEGQAA